MAGSGMTDSDHVMQLRQQVANLHARLNRIMEGLEGTCMTCEPVGVRNQQMEQHIKKLQAERDEARREVCAWQAGDSGKSFRQIATVRGWDCFGESK
jgi:septal ring factor EnvC (AmiA/AmiB activator)